MATLNDKDLIQEYFSDTFTDFDKEYVARKKAWDKWNATWRGQFQKGGSTGNNVDGVFTKGSSPTSHKSQLFVNSTKQAIVTAVSNVMGILFQQLPPFVVRGRASTLDDGIAEMIQKVVWYFMQQSKFPVHARKYITNAAIYGSAWGKVFIEDVRHTSIESRPQTDIVTGQAAGFQKFAKTQVFPMVRFENVDIYDLWKDPESDWLNTTGKGIYHRIWKSPTSIQEQIIRGKYRAIDSKLLNASKGSTHDTDVRRTIEGLQPLSRTMLSTMDFWGVMPQDVAEQAGIEFPSDELDVPVHCILLFDKSKMVDYLFVERNQLPGHALPFVHDVWEDVGHGADGRGITENTEGPQTALNVTVNTRLDNKATAIQQIIAANIDVLEDPEEDLKFKQNWIIRTNGNPREAIYPLTVPDLTAGSHVEAKEFERMIEESSGINKFVSGTESFGSNRTASGINTVFQAASRFLRDITSQMEYNLMAGTAKLFYQHVIQFMPDQFLVDITDNPQAPKLREIALQKIVQDVDFIAFGVQGLQIKEVELNQLIQFAQTTANPIDMQYINRPLLLKNIYERFGFKDGDKIILQTPQAPPQGEQGGNPEAIIQALKEGTQG